MTSILVPTDFSAGAQAAVRFGIALANRTEGAKLVLLAAYHLPPPPAELAWEAIENFHGRIEEDTRKQLAALEAEVNGQLKVPCEAHCVQGFAAEVILAEMAARRPMLTVMGSRGATGLERVFFGSVASEVAKQTEQPLLVVPETAAVGTFEQVLFATDFQEGDEALAAKLPSYAPDERPVHVTFIHVADGKEPTLHERAHLEAFQQRARAVADAPDMAFEFVRYPDVSEAVQDRLKDGAFDVLVLAPGHRGWLSRLFDPSVSAQMLKHLTIPVLLSPVPQA